MVINMHTMSTSFVGKVTDVQQMPEVQNGERGLNVLKFQAQVRGHEAN